MIALTALIAACVVLLIKDKGNGKKEEFRGLTRLEMAQATAKVMRYEKARRKAGKGRHYGRRVIR